MFSQLRQSTTEPFTILPKALFSTDEAILIRQIKQALPNCVLIPNIRVSSILKLSTPENKKQQAAFRKIMDTTIDFAIFNKKMELVCLIHLRREDESELDTVLRKTIKAAGIKQLFWQRNPFPSFEHIVKQLCPAQNFTPASTENALERLIQPEFEAVRVIKKIPEGELVTLHEHDNPNAISLARLSELCREENLKLDYPHIWKRICLLLASPADLKNYLDTLFTQDRPLKRKGLPRNALNEVINIQNENDLYH